MGTDFKVTVVGEKLWNQAIEEACNEFVRTPLPMYRPELELPSYQPGYEDYNVEKKPKMTDIAKKYRALADITEEYESASSKFPPFASAHEGFAILKEEVDELWDEVKKNPATRSNMALEKEAIQVAAMALRFLVDVCYKGK